MGTGQLLSYIRVRIQLDQPWRVGAPSEDRSRQAALTNPDRDVWLPASGLAGSFAAHASQHLTGGELGRHERDSQDAEKTRYFASALWFLGVTLDGGELRTRTGTSISRNRRAARKSGSHQIDEVHGTTTATLYLCLEGQPQAVLEQLATWPVTVGGGITTGLGQARVTELRYRTLNLATAEGLLIRAQNPGGPAGIDALVDGPEGHAYEFTPGTFQREVLRAVIDVHDLHVVQEPKADHRWFQGSRWKGILRSRVEYIGRSLGLAICGADDEATWDGCGACGVCDVFGSSATGAGRWAFHATDLSPGAPIRKRQRVAIDRFTGGAADQKLLEECTQTIAEMQLVITTLRPLEQRHAWVAKALVLALRDLADGYFGIGGRSATGLGSVTVSEVSVGEELARFLGEASFERPAFITQADLDLEPAKRKETTDA